MKVFCSNCLESPPPFLGLSKKMQKKNKLNLAFYNVMECSKSKTTLVYTSKLFALLDSGTEINVTTRAVMTFSC